MRSVKVIVTVAIAVLAGAPVAQAEPSRWTGFYAGVNAGWVGSSDDTIRNSGTDTDGGGFGTGLANGSDPTTIDRSYGGFLGGGQIGYNMQLGAAVVGVEADFQGSDASDSTSVAGKLPFVPQTFTASRTLDWLGTVRGRLGFVPEDGWLIYGTGGLAYGKTSLGIGYICPTCVPPANISGETTSTEVGWTVGGGAEVAVTDTISLKGEYLYYDLGSNSTTIVYKYAGETSSLTARTEETGQLVRAGLNYKF